VTTAASIALTESVSIPWFGVRRNTKGGEHGRGHNQLFQFRLPHTLIPTPRELIQS
jgi:hypothetical protein